MTDQGSNDDVVSDDTGFLGGRLQLRQYRTGHRAGTDAVLLATAVAAGHGECLLDAGAGVGAAGLAVLVRSPGAKAILVERDPRTADLARHNAVANGLADRANVVEADIFDKARCDAASLRGCADVVISNPPFFLPGSVRVSRDAGRRSAHVLDQGGHGEWLARLVTFLRPKGRLVIIHRPDALSALLAGSHRLGCVRLRAIHPRAEQDAIRIVLSSILDSKAPTTIAPALILHQADGMFTPEAAQLHRGEGWLMSPKEKAG